MVGVLPQNDGADVSGRYIGKRVQDVALRRIDSLFPSQVVNL